jgi:hypothetical protein
MTNISSRMACDTTDLVGSTHRPNPGFEGADAQSARIDVSSCSLMFFKEMRILGKSSFAFWYRHSQLLLSRRWFFGGGSGPPSGQLATGVPGFCLFAPLVRICTLHLQVSTKSQEQPQMHA